MNPALAVVRKTEKELAALLVAGLATPRGGREQLGELADELAGLKLDRLAVELRRLAAEQDPRTLTASALTALAMAGKVAERLLPWPTVDASPSVPYGLDPCVRLAYADAAPPSEDTAALAHDLETGGDLRRAQAVATLVGQGEAALPALADLAAHATGAVRRDAIAALARIGGPAALRALVGLVGDDDCWRALLGAIRPYGHIAVPLLADALASAGTKKAQLARRRQLAALLYRLGARGELRGLAEDEDPVLRGFGLAAAPPSAKATGITLGILAMVQAETANGTGTVIAGIDRLPADEARAVSRWMVIGSLVSQIGESTLNEARALGRWLVGSPLEMDIAEYYLSQLAAAKAKDRERAGAVLKGLADPRTVIPVAAAAESGTFDAGSAAEVLGAIGGSQAVGILQAMIQRFPSQVAAKAVGALGEIGDPGAAAPLLTLLAATLDEGQEQRAGFSSLRPSIESALIALGDGAVDYLADEMRASAGTPLADAIQQLLLQVKTRRAKEALKGTQADSPDALLARLGHPKLGAEAAKLLAKQGEAVLDRLADVVEGTDHAAQRNALSALRTIGGPRVYEIVHASVKRALSRPSPDWREADICTIGFQMLLEYADRQDLQLYLRGLASVYPTIQREASNAVVKCGPTIAPLVLPLLDTAKPTARAQAVRVLGRLGIVAAEAKGLEMLGDKQPALRAAAAEALGALYPLSANPQTVPALLTALGRESDWSATAAVIRALGATGQRSAIGPLRKYAESHRYYGNQVQAAIARIEASSASGGVLGRLRGLLGGR